MDERAQQIGTRAATITLAIAYVFWLGVAFSKFIGTRRIETAATEIVFLALFCCGSPARMSTCSSPDFTNTPTSRNS